MGAILVRSAIIITAAALLALAALNMTARAQTCTGDPCIFYTPTANNTATPLPTPGPGTPTAVPMAEPIPFPRPFYGVPTSIPAYTFPDVPDGYQPTPLALPSPLSFSITPQPFSTPVATSPTGVPWNNINTAITVTYRSPNSLNTSVSVTGSVVYTAAQGLIGPASGYISGVVSYTDYLSTTAAAINPQARFTVTNAPDWYAPALPRPMADIGWTFETQLAPGVDTGVRYSLPQWAWFIGYMVSMPFQLLKVLFQIVQFLGPLGLFIVWLLVMTPPVTVFKIIIFIKNMFISLLNLIIKIFSLLLDLFSGLLEFVVKLFV